MTLVYEETLLSRHSPGLPVRDLYCSEFKDAMKSIADILSDESPATSPREWVDREARRSRRG